MCCCFYYHNRVVVCGVAGLLFAAPLFQTCYIFNIHCMCTYKINLAIDPLPNCYAVTTVVALLSIMASLSECSMQNVLWNSWEVPDNI